MKIFVMLGFLAMPLIFINSAEAQSFMVRGSGYRTHTTGYEWVCMNTSREEDCLKFPEQKTRCVNEIASSGKYEYNCDSVPKNETIHVKYKAKVTLKKVGRTCKMKIEFKSPPDTVLSLKFFDSEGFEIDYVDVRLYGDQKTLTQNWEQPECGSIAKGELSL